ncbi:MAG: DsrE/DsrF/DrsH-like family protein [Gemmatimonadetes bacterium]|nr:DsrE/DsrF/DrsH-like family protein [Gemmatimonadota bacterium]
MAEKAEQPKKMVIIASKGMLDWAYPPLILASTAAAMGWEVGIFFTFYGLNIIHKDKYDKLKVAPLGNPAMPMPVPNLVGAIPGMTQVGTKVMKSMFKAHGVASVEDLLEMCMDLGVKMMPCGMTIEVFGYDHDDFMEGIDPVCGAAHFIEYAADADVALFV